MYVYQGKFRRLLLQCNIGLVLRIIELLEHAECCSITNHFTVWIAFQCFQQCLAMIWFHMVNDDVIKVATISKVSQVVEVFFANFSINRVYNTSFSSSMK